MSRADVAIYAPSAGKMYAGEPASGGAERQLTLLARALAGRGRRVVHIVYPLRERPSLPPGLSLVERPLYAGNGPVIGRLIEAVYIWRAFGAADAEVIVVRTGTPVVGLAALFCRTRRRKLIFSTASDSDLTLESVSDRRHRRLLYVMGVRLADAVVVQSQEQLALARQAFPGLDEVVYIPSLAETFAPPPPDGVPSTFIWIGRLEAYKQPLRYLELARTLPGARFIMIVTVPANPSPSLEDLQAAAADIPNLELLERLPHAQTVELIARTVAVVNTSRIEGMPNIFLEAWGCGVPVLTLEFDPDAVIVTRGLGIAAGGSWERFASGARELWENRARRDELSQRTRSYIDEMHSVDAVGARWSELITHVVQH